MFEIEQSLTFSRHLLSRDTQIFSILNKILVQMSVSLGERKPQVEIKYLNCESLMDGILKLSLSRLTMSVYVAKSSVPQFVKL